MKTLLTTLLLLWTLTLHATISPGPPIPTLTIPPDSLTNHPTESISGNPELDAEIRAELTRMLGHDPLATNVAPRDMPITLTVDAEGARDNVEGIANLTGDALVKLKQAKGWLQQLELEGNFVTDLRNQEKKLPLGIRKNIGGVTLTLAIGEVRLLPEGTEVDVVMSIEIPGVPDKLILGASDVGFSFSGGFTGQLTLELLGNYGINIAKGKSRLVFFTGNPERRTGTYAKVTCAGFEELNIQASLIMSRDWVKPFRGGELMTNEAITGIVERQGATGQVVPPDAAMNLQKLYRVHWDFEFNLAGEDGFYIQTGSKDTFAINGYNDFSIYADDITLDFSDVQNPGNVFPDNYNSPYVTNGDASPLWRGVYIGSIQIGLPADWRGGDKPPIEIFGRSIIIDDMGFTGMVGVNNLIPLKEGSVDSWAFSLDTFRLEIMQNQIQRVGMAGLINVPLLKADSTAGVNNSDTLRRVDCLSYLAVIQPGSFYQFVATTNSSYTIDIWKSSLTLRPGCSVEILSDDGYLSASATLFGDIKIDASIGDGEKFGLKADGIGFDSLVVSTSDGFEKLGKWTFPREVSGQLGPFGITFSQISLTKNAATKEAFLKFASMVEVEGETTGLAAGGAFELQGTYATEDDGKQKYKFTKFKVNALRVAMTTSSFAVDVTVALYKKHAIYGNGFYGKGILILKAAGGGGIAAVAQFGRVTPEGEEGYNYFFLDGMFKFPRPAPVVGPFELLAMGGGVYINMERQEDPRQNMATDINAEVDARLNEIDLEAAPDNLSQFVGRSLSGQRFAPNKGSSGGKIAVILALAGINETVNINAAIELDINADNGWRLAILGNGTFFDEVNFANVPQENGLAAFFEISYVKDSESSRFLAAVDFFIGYPPLDGYVIDSVPSIHEQSYPVTLSSYAGGIYLLFDDDGLTFNIGNPVLGLEIDIPVIGRVEAFAYFHMGNNVMPMPPLPDYVASFAGGEANFLRNESLFASGRGIAFGARLSLSIDPRIPIFYVRVNASIGFDINFQKYPGAICLETGNSLGINEWFGAGQAWAFLSGSVGMEFRIPFRGKVQFEIASLALGAILQAKGPNPIYATGALGGKFSILNGFIKGNFRMQFKAGTECTLVAANGGDVMANVQTVSVVLPSDESTDVAPDAILQLLTNFPIGTDSIEFDTEFYRLEIGTFTLSGPEGNVAGEMVFDLADYDARFVTEEILAGNTNYLLSGNVLLRSLSSNQIVNDTSIVISFTTGEGYQHIPESNIASSYPTDGMYNFYRNESSTGYINLIQGQASLLETTTNAYFITGNGQMTSTVAIYNRQRKRLEFPIPDLNGETIYSLLIGRPGMQGNGMGQFSPLPVGYEPGYLPSSSGPQEPSITFSPLVAAPGDTMLTLYFRTSAYATFREKINAQLKDQTVDAQEFILLLHDDDETYGQLELFGNANNEPLINIRAVASNQWYDQFDLDRMAYRHYPSELGEYPLGIDWRESEDSGPPLELVFLSIDTLLRTIDQTHWEAGSIQLNQRRDTFKFLYPSMVLLDAENFRRQLERVAVQSFNDAGSGSMANLRNVRFWCDFGMYELQKIYCRNYRQMLRVDRPQDCNCDYYSQPQCDGQSTGDGTPLQFVLFPPMEETSAGVQTVPWQSGQIARLALLNCGSSSDEVCEWCPQSNGSDAVRGVKPWMSNLFGWKGTTALSPYNTTANSPNGYSFPVTVSYTLPGESEPNSTVPIDISVGN